jgi:hypothetical protein
MSDKHTKDNKTNASGVNAEEWSATELNKARTWQDMVRSEKWATLQEADKALDDLHLIVENISVLKAWLRDYYEVQKRSRPTARYPSKYSWPRAWPAAIIDVFACIGKDGSTTVQGARRRLTQVVSALGEPWITRVRHHRRFLHMELDKCLLQAELITKKNVNRTYAYDDADRSANDVPPAIFQEVAEELSAPRTALEKAQPAPASAPAATHEVPSSDLEARLQRLETHVMAHRHDLPTSIMERLSACEKREYADVHTRSATITLSGESVIIKVEGTAAERAEDYPELKEAAREGLQALLHRRMKPLPDIPTNSIHGGYVTPQPKKSS